MPISIVLGLFLTSNRYANKAIIAPVPSPIPNHITIGALSPRTPAIGLVRACGKQVASLLFHHSALVCLAVIEATLNRKISI